MNISFWNARGCKRPLLLEEVKDFCKNNNVHVMMLCETKTSSPPTETFVRFCGFHHHDFLPSFGIAGGMWIFWKNVPSHPFLFTVDAKFDRFIVCNVKVLAMNVSFKLIFIYAPPNNNLKIQFWKS